MVNIKHMFSMFPRAHVSHRYLEQLGTCNMIIIVHNKVLFIFFDRHEVFYISNRRENLSIQNTRIHKNYNMHISSCIYYFETVFLFDICIVACL